MRKPETFQEMADQAMFQVDKDALIALYNRSREVGNDLAKKLIPMNLVSSRLIKARAELAEAYDDMDYGTIKKAKKELNESIVESVLLIDELNSICKEESC